MMSRIPNLLDTSAASVRSWFQSLHDKGLLYCLDDDPVSLVRIDNNERLFSDAAALEVSVTTSRILDSLGDRAHDIALDVLRRTFLTPQEYSLANIARG
ncbi:hypothetical protein [Casimicrobium huifangae]|uniref:hypothetical protein n=1 Tax=Casimicrobium huifangae TaxID=2591109 RepID=UPI0012EC3062|nr:hypothetical protein [Casimicrobium huifangae]